MQVYVREDLSLRTQRDEKLGGEQGVGVDLTNKSKNCRSPAVTVKRCRVKARWHYLGRSQRK